MDSRRASYTLDFSSHECAASSTKLLGFVLTAIHAATEMRSTIFWNPR
jgi:hypothetical protein